MRTDPITTITRLQYGFYFSFDLAGTVELEVKATGIVNAYVLAEGEKRDDAHEVIVAPRIAAQHHQHVSGTSIPGRRETSLTSTPN
jgi:primary-amine oxidase